MNPGTNNKTAILRLTWLLLLLATAPLAAASEKRHGISFFGDLKYPPDFQHFDYVNPDAPKVGTMRQAELGNFDTLNSFIRKGRKAAGLNGTSVSIYDRLMFDADDEAKKVGAVDANLEGVAKRWATEYDFPGYRQGLFIKDLIVTERPWGMENGMTFNLRKPKFQDIRVREALATAYDFEWSNRVLYHSFYEPADSFFENSYLAQRGLPSKEELELLEPFRDQIPPRVFTDVFQPSVTKGYGYARENLLRAARLLKEAGWVVRDNVLVNRQTGEPFTIELISYSIYGERAMMPFVNAVKRLGITCRIRTIEVSQYINRLGTHDFGGIMEGYAQTLTPGIELRNYWGSLAASRQYSRNTAGIEDPVVDHLIEKVIGARTQLQLISATRALDRVLLWNYYMIPGFWPPGYRYGYWDKFGRPKTQARFRTGLFDTWWIDTEREANIAASLGNR